MEPQDEFKIPIDPKDPQQIHVQVMFALGQISAKQTALADYQRIANGRTSKLEDRVTAVQKWQDTEDGRNTGIALTWGKIGAFMGSFLVILIAAIGILIKLLR